MPFRVLTRPHLPSHAPPGVALPIVTFFVISYPPADGGMLNVRLEVPIGWFSARGPFFRNGSLHTRLRRLQTIDALFRLVERVESLQLARILRWCVLCFLFRYFVISGFML